MPKQAGEIGRDGMDIKKKDPEVNFGGRFSKNNLKVEFENTNSRGDCFSA